MISIVCACIPSYLRYGSFYRSLNSEEKDCEIQIPAQCYTENDTVSDINDLAQLLRVTAFWSLDRIPQTIIAFCDKNDVNEWDSLFKLEFAELPFATSLRTIFTERWQRGPFLVTAIKSGVDEIVEYLVAKYKGGEDVAGEAALQGRLDYLQLLHRQGHPWGFSVCDCAVRGGHVHCLQYLNASVCCLSSTLYLTAASSGQLDCLQYLYDLGLSWHEETAEILTELGHLDMLKYATEHSCPLDKKSVVAAAKFGQLDCLQYLIDVQCPMDDNLCYFAAGNGHLDCLKLLHQHGSVWKKYTTEVAAQNGHLDCLVYLHENGCPWDKLVPAGATKNGHVNVLRYAIEYGCPHDPDILLLSICTDASGALECLKYLIEERGVLQSADGAEFAESFTHGNHQAMQYLIEQDSVYKQCVLSEKHFIDLLPRTRSNIVQIHYFFALDAKLVKCMECAVLSDWSMEMNGTDLCKFVKSRANRLTLCADYLASIGF